MSFEEEQRTVRRQLDVEIKQLKALITELAEAVQYCHVYRINDATIEYHRELMQRARDAVSLSNGEATR